jgi:catechol 2,3-dioxygenase-like lactoylglutathione lyase family enzyme
MTNTRSKRKIITLFVVSALIVSIGTVSAFAAASASRVNPANLHESVAEDGTPLARIYVNKDENGEPVDLTDEEWQEVYELMAFRDENGNIIEHVCTDECKDGHPLELTVYHVGE